MKEAKIALILKPGKNALERASYRPIALINVDAKIHTKILANRLEGLLPDLIHQDQAGFIKGRQTADNIRRVAHLVEKAEKTLTPAVGPSLDAEKAFDQVEWSSLFKSMARMGLGGSFLQRVKANYDSPRARVVVNGTTSRSFLLQRGTKQGCPLSPLLYAIYLEPLLQAIRELEGIHGIPFGGRQHRVAAFADYMLLALTNPLELTKNCRLLLEDFGKASGLRISPN